MLDRPYFMESREWYSFDFDKRKYVLTDKAPEEARKSYEEWEKALKKLNK